MSPLTGTSTRKDGSKSKFKREKHNETFGLHPEALLGAEALFKVLHSYVSDFQGVFKIKHSPSYDFSIKYLKGLIQCEKKKATCTGISEVVPQTNDQSVNHFISNSRWDYKELMEKISERACAFFKGKCKLEETCLIVDEVGFPKKGKNSACVARQWLGCIGKQDNGQVAVCLTLCNNFLFSIIRACLFMPKCWSHDSKRREKAKLPEGLGFKTKVEIALEMIKETVRQKIHFSWIAFDALYGSCFAFLKELDDMGLVFIGDVKKDIAIYPEKPNVAIPEQKGKGRKFRFPRPASEETQIQAYVKALEEKDWEKIAIRQSTDGPLVFYYHKKQVWLWDEEKRELFSYLLVVRKSLDGTTIKYSFSNAPSTTPLKRLAFMQGQRFFIEQSIKESKNQVGMGDYQVRSWDGFHKHLAMCMLSMNFIMEQKFNFQQQLPAITAPGIVEIMKAILPNKKTNVREVIQDVIRRTIIYGRQIEYRRQKKMNEQRISI